MSIAQVVDSDPRRAAREREKLRYSVVRDMRSAGRWDASDSEIEAELDRRETDLAKRRAAQLQLQLPLMDVAQVPAATKRDSCSAGRVRRIRRREAILDLLEKAGPGGMTRGEVAAAMGVYPSSVSAPINYLVNEGVVCQPRSKQGPHGVDVAVVVLTRFAGGLDNA